MVAMQQNWSAFAINKHLQQIVKVQTQIKSTKSFQNSFNGHKDLDETQ